MTAHGLDALESTRQHTHTAPARSRAGTLSLSAASVQAIGKTDFEFIEDIMLGGGLDAAMAQGFLCLAQIFLGQLGADEAPKVMRFDMLQPDDGGILLHGLPHRGRAHRRGGGPHAAPGKAGKHGGTLHRPARQPGFDEHVRFLAERRLARRRLVLAQNLDDKTPGPRDNLRGRERHHLRDTAARAGQRRQQGAIAAAPQPLRDPARRTAPASGQG